VRDTALSTVLSLYERGELATIIEEYSVMYLRFVMKNKYYEMAY
jgi:hypothetical protein